VEVGIKKAQTNLSQLVKAAQKGQKVFLMNRSERVAEIVPVRPKRSSKSALPGYGMFRGQLRTPPEWGTPEAEEREEKEIRDMLSKW
jgi:prevent-host-death family protein